MASTSVHLSPALVDQLDRLAEARGVSRNRVIVEACEQLVARSRPDWPDGFFDTPLSGEDLAELQGAGHELEEAIYASRRDRPVQPL